MEESAGVVYTLRNPRCAYDHLASEVASEKCHGAQGQKATIYLELARS